MLILEMIFRDAPTLYIRNSLKIVSDLCRYNIEGEVFMIQLEVCNKLRDCEVCASSGSELCSALNLAEYIDVSRYLKQSAQ